MLKNIIDEKLSPSIKKPKLLDQLRAIIRTKHYSLRTEESYIQWIKRFIIFHNKRHPNEMSEVEINQFLSHLAVKKNVAASTQNQALCALVFLYKHVLKKKMIPGQPGTKKWLEKYGDALICVRYRDDHQSQRRLKTIELVVESAPLKINKNTIPMNKIMCLRIGYHEKYLQNIVKGAGGRWNKQKQAWELAYKEIRLLGLENRIIRKMANNRNIKSRSPP